MLRPDRRRHRQQAPLSNLLYRTLVAIALLARNANCHDTQHSLDDSHTFVSRPDLEAPSWNITVFDPDSISPGYWFVEPYDFLDQSTRNGGNWTAPMVFDQTGELVWSGAYLSQQYDTFDFKVSNVLGEDMLTFLYPRNRSLVILDSQFRIYKQLQISSPTKELDNMHDLNLVNDGTRALFFYDETREATTAQSEAVGFTEGKCTIRDNSFREVDLLDDWRVVYRWSSSKRIALTESTLTDQPVEERCNATSKGWDWIHANSIDRFADGSYLLSGRHTNTIYKIYRSGDIAWRLGGKRSDFDTDFDFKRQHHARILSQNATHTIVSFFDNASAEDKEKGTAKWSRGVIVALRTDTIPMTATLIAEYGHPDGPGSFTLGRGSTQVLPNGNVFSGWVNGCLQSEHSSDGKILMQARMKQEWLKSYRSYKFPFTGRPEAPPDVYAAVNGGPSVRTTVHVSWNGATEVSNWKLYKTTADGKTETDGPVSVAARSGFETRLDIDGYATFVVLEGIDAHGESLGRSAIIQTEGSSALPSDVLQQEKQWLERVSSTGVQSWKSTVTSTNGAASLVGGVFLVITCLLVFRLWRRRGGWRKRGPSYEMVDGREEAFELADDEHDEEDDRSSVGKSRAPFGQGT